MFLFFLVVLDDFHDNYTYYYLSFTALFIIQFVLTFSGRIIILNVVKKQINSAQIHFNAAIIGNHENALRIPLHFRFAHCRLRPSHGGRFEKAGRRASSRDHGRQNGRGGKAHGRLLSR
jgi:hypothetical protein